jgi:hypothetical protein
MKKLLLSICLVALCLLKANAQEPKMVSTEPSKRNVLIEELTGRSCTWCPLGQLHVNQALTEFPGRVFTANIHSDNGTGALSPKTYPNLNTIEGYDIYNLFGNGNLPGAIINRTDKAASLNSSVNRWMLEANKILSQSAECNIAGSVTINPDTRLARITVEVYYTADSQVENNYLTIIMLQDSIIGPQKGAEDNPDQIIGDQYCHMHVYRNTLTDQWGDAIAPTTAGTLITKTYEYTIPESIGEPNGVKVDLNNVHFLAFVTEHQDGGAKTMPILNVCQLQHIENGESVEENVETTSYVYPNPVKDVLTITAENIKQVVMYNSLGQVVKTVAADEDDVQINVSDLQNGMYFVNVETADGNHSLQKVVVNK